MCPLPPTEGTRLVPGGGPSRPEGEVDRGLEQEAGVSGRTAQEDHEQGG